MTYHLRRLRLHGLTERVPHTHRYLVTDFGLSAAIFLTRAYARFITGALSDLVGPDPPPRYVAPSPTSTPSFTATPDAPAWRPER
jgi:hypothetical protein